MEKPQVFYTYDWAMAVQRAYAKHVSPQIFLAYEEDSLAGVVALGRRTTGEFAFLAADTGDYCDFLSEPGKRQQFIEMVFSELRNRKAAKVVLTNLPADSASADVISGTASKGRYHLHVRPAYDCAQVRLGSAEEREALKQSVHAKKRLRRNIRELTKRGGVTLWHETGWNEIEDLLPSFMQAHIARFLETGKLSSLITEERRTFLQELGRELAQSGWLAFSRLLVGDVTAAWNYGFRFAGSWFWYQPTVNEVYWDFSPGYCLLAKIIELGCDMPQFNVVDMGLGAEGYKERFANESRRTLYCELNSSLIRHWRTTMRARLSAAVTASPAIEKSVRSFVARGAEIRNSVQVRGLGGVLWAMMRRIARALFSHDRVLFFEWPPDSRSPELPATHLQLLTSETLGRAAVQYGNDPASLRFLMRSAQRLRSGNGDGYALMTSDGLPVHFCWAKDFQGFEMAELDRSLHAPCNNAVMIFDCFTPEAARGHGFFPEAIALLARDLTSRGKSAWIFGAETNQASVHGIQKTGFRYRFTLGRRRLFFLSSVADSVHADEQLRDESTISG